MTLKINRINIKEFKKIRFKLSSEFKTTEQSTEKEIKIESKILQSESDAIYELQNFLRLLNELQKNESIEIEFDIPEKE